MQVAELLDPDALEVNGNNGVLDETATEKRSRMKSLESDMSEFRASTY